MTTISKVWNHRPNHKVGQHVLDLQDLEGFGLTALRPRNQRPVGQVTQDNAVLWTIIFHDAVIIP